MIGSDDIRFENVRLATGLRLHTGQRGDPLGEAILFLHGWPDSWFSFSRVLALLPNHVRALAFDQRGFGDSDKPESGYGIPDFAADAVALLDALGIDRATLVGHSYGSFVARQVAIEWPERVARLALIGTGFTRTNPVMREFQTAVRDIPDRYRRSSRGSSRQAPPIARCRRSSSTASSPRA